MQKTKHIPIQIFESEQVGRKLVVFFAKVLKLKDPSRPNFSLRGSI
jgi:hypothetical protein